jgi:uncharacterized membrane protein YhaH (DUF805 family)
MRLRLADLVRPDAGVGRLPYFAAGVVLLAVKHSLDWLLATQLFHRSWTPWGYFVLPTQTVGVLLLKDDERFFYGTLLALAVPFILIGVWLTVKRLRDVGWPIALVVFFFVPVVNLLLFVVLSLLPPRPESPARPLGPDDGPLAYRPAALGDLRLDYRGTPLWERLRDAHRRLTRDTTTGAAILALTLTVPPTLAFVVLATAVLQNYGWGLFVGGPFALGLASVVVFGAARPQSFGLCMLIAFLATTTAGLGVLVFAMEGAICLLMAAPIGFGLAFMGGLIGYVIQLRPWNAEYSPYILLAVALTLPSLTAAEAADPPDPEVMEVSSVVEVDAPPETVWNEVITFPELPPPDDWVFHTGVAYPVRAEIVGRGVGAERHCVFSTGAFVEPIDGWDEPRRLSFRVTDQPEPMREWSPYTLHPPHLHGYLVSRRGEFRLTPLDGGRTRLEGTTWYTNRMWPAWYWRLWSDAIIHRIHLRVLNHVKGLAEADSRGDAP